MGRILARAGVVAEPIQETTPVKGSCRAFCRLGIQPDDFIKGWSGPALFCSKNAGHGGRHAAHITNSPLGWIVAVWA